MFHFDPSAAIQKELKPGINLTDLEWPSAIKSAVRAVEIASKVMFVLYCISVGAVGLALIGAFWGLVREGRLVAISNNIISLVSQATIILYVPIADSSQSLLLWL